jgi:hypothetical protein
MTSGVCFHVRDIFVSTAAPWAAAKLVPCSKSRTDTALAVFQRVSDEWRLRDLGTAGVGCMAPARVRRDLHLACLPADEQLAGA